MFKMVGNHYITSRPTGEIEGISFVHLTSKDVVRHRIVQDIVDAYNNKSPKKNPVESYRPISLPHHDAEADIERLNVGDGWPN